MMNEMKSLVTYVRYRRNSADEQAIDGHSASSHVAVDAAPFYSNMIHIYVCVC